MVVLVSQLSVGFARNVTAPTRVILGVRGVGSLVLWTAPAL